ncbi:MAG: LytTR family DNA-binding domain-containing protein [Chitinophagaceae bacterium]
MINAIIIDDEQPCITALQNDLRMFCPQVKVIDTCSSSREGLLSIRKNKPDLVFLDIAMPVINGFELLEMLGEEAGFQLIFTTAYEQFATRAFRVSAVDYLLKPIDGNDLSEAVRKAEKAIERNQPDNNQPAAGHQKIALPNRDGYDFIATSDILYCRAEGAYTHIILKDQRKLLLSKPLGEIEGLLPASLFERIHHSYLINISQVHQFRKTEGASLIMNNGDQLSIARSKKDQLMKRLGINPK